MRNPAYTQVAPTEFENLNEIPEDVINEIPKQHCNQSNDQRIQIGWVQRFLLSLLQIS